MRRILCIGISFLTLCAAACSSYWDTAIKNTYAYLGRSIPIPAFHAAIPFDEIAFQMPDTERLTEEIARLKERVNSGEAAKGLQSELESLYAELSAMETMAQYAYVRHCLDTKNPVWGERSDRLNAKIDMLYASLNAIALQLSERKELKNDYSPQVVERLKVAASLYAPEVAPLMEQERTLMDEYDRMQTAVLGMVRDLSGLHGRILKMRERVVSQTRCHTKGNRRSARISRLLCLSLCRVWA